VQWYGIVAPAKTPAPIVERLNKEIAGTLESPELAKYLANEGALATRSSPEEFRAYMKSEIARWRQVINDAGIPRAS
jgi:tripartite-type tricarboxylate transporter receptor subunit TctC